jgi:hypothetical protein
MRENVGLKLMVFLITFICKLHEIIPFDEWKTTNLTKNKSPNALKNVVRQAITSAKI